MVARVLGGLALSLLSTAAFAADLGAPPIVVPADAPTYAGYIAVQGGAQTTFDDYSNGDTPRSSGLNLSAAARGAVVIDPSFSLQGDLWVRDFVERNDKNTAESWQDVYPGATLHASWLSGDGNLLGVFGSVGGDIFTPLQNDPAAASTRTDLNGGIEGVANYDNLRFYGQIGVNNQVDGPVSTGNLHNLYAILDTTYFVDPNFALSAWVGANGYEDNYASGTGARIGARIEYKPDGLPFSMYVSYQARGVWDNFSAGPDAGLTENGGEQTAMVGIRVPIGVSTVQDLEKSVGLSDMNPNFGEFPQ